MAYTDQINSLKEALNSYSAEEEKLSALYKTAIENAEKAHQTAKAQLEAQYQRDRNAVYADNARSERNLNNLLAERGLGFSGEAAQSKLNSNITLSNRLGDLEREKNQSSLKLDADLASNKTTLSMEEAEKLKNILDSKNQLGADIAGMELERENEANRLQFDRETEANKLQAEKEALAQQILADKQALADKLNAEQQAQYAQLQADREAKKLELQAEKDMLAIKLQAEKDMLQQELEAKYNSVLSGDTSASGSKDKNTGSDKSDTAGTQSNTDIPADDPSDDGGSFIPNINAPSLAKQLVNTATSGNGYVSDDDHDHIINKYLIQLREGYDIDEEYYNELVFMLKAYGYVEKTYPEMRVQVITHDAEAYYEDIYDEAFDSYALNGMDDAAAQKKARETAAEKQIEYMYKKSNSVLEFKECCKQMGIGNAKAQEYINAMKSDENTTTPSSGNLTNQTTRTGK